MIGFLLVMALISCYVCLTAFDGGQARESDLFGDRYIPVLGPLFENSLVLSGLPFMVYQVGLEQFPGCSAPSPGPVDLGVSVCSWL